MGRGIVVKEGGWFKKYIVYPSIITIILLLVLGGAYYLNWFEPLERLSYDLRFHLRGIKKPDPRIIIVAKDEESKRILKKRGTDFTRSYYAKVINNLTKWGAKVIAMDFEFSHPVFQDEAQDENLANALEESGKVVLARFIQNGRPIPPFELFRELELGEGFINLTLDPDGVLRKVPLLELDLENDKFIPYFSFALESYLDFLYPPSVSMPALELSSTKNSIPPGYFKVGDQLFPDHIYINFVGPPGTFRMVSFWKVLKGKVTPSIFKNKIVLVGSTIPADHDFYKVPFSGKEKKIKSKEGAVIEIRGSELMSGIEVHANIIQSLAEGNYIKRWMLPNGMKSPLNYYLLIGVILLSALIFIYLPSGVLLSLSLFLIGGAAYSYLSYYLFKNQNFWLETVAPLFSWSTVFVAGIFYHRYMEAKEKKFVKDTFSRYVSPQIVKELLSKPDLLKLGGHKKDVTVIFSDIRSFTTLSEGMDPEELVNFLNEYLSEMTGIIFKHRGVVDKYIGDAIMAFWGAPIDDPDHPVLACETALEMLERLKDLNKRWREQGKKEISIGIGINSGEVTVGNMGSNVRFDYTVMGDNVNLASRLEGINKQYKTRIVLSQFTYERVKDRFVTRKLDRVAVKGKKKPVEIYDLVGRKGEVSTEVLKKIKLFEKGLESYFTKKFEEARKYFLAVLKLDPEDGPSRVFVERCENLMNNPPPPDWDGVFVMKTK